MRIKEKTNLLLEIAAWGSIAINGLVFIVFYYFKKNDINTLIFAIVSSILVAILGFVKIDRDIAISDLSLGSVIMTWFGFLILSVILAYHLFSVSIFGGVVLILALILEISTVFIIIYRHRLYNFLKNIKRKQRQ